MSAICHQSSDRRLGGTILQAGRPLLVAVEHGLGGVDEEADDGTDDDEVEEHLDADEDAGPLLSGVMSPKPTVESTVMTR